MELPESPVGDKALGNPTMDAKEVLEWLEEHVVQFTFSDKIKRISEKYPFGFELKRREDTTAGWIQRFVSTFNEIQKEIESGKHDDLID